MDMKPAQMFEGPAGRVTAMVMARRNRAAEREAVDVLDPSPGASVLAIGIGPGLGVELLAERLGRGNIAGIDPSEVMVREARRRCRRLWIPGVLRPELVTLTHAWAIERTGRSVAEWVRWLSGLCAEHGLAGDRHWRARAEHGTSVALRVVKEDAAVRRASLPPQLW